MRGTHAAWKESPCHSRIIPAYAGNTKFYYRGSSSSWDHPRVCGEHASSRFLAAAHRGSSPRMRGTPLLRSACVFVRGIIPAYAGNTPTAKLLHFKFRDHPRVCGEHNTVIKLCRVNWGSSPRMRGTQLDKADIPYRIGIIPAYAGNTLRDYSNFVVSKFMSFVFHLV